MALNIMSEVMSEPTSVTDTKDTKEKEGESADDSKTTSVEKKDSKPQTQTSDESSTVKSDINEKSENTTRNKNSKKPWPLTGIKEPHENDVLYGRGGGTNHHPGNKRYRKIVETRKEDYTNSKRLDKPLVAMEIIKQWRSQDPPGRFLKQDDATGMWNDVGDKKAREKTSQALREKAPQHKEKNRENKQSPRSDNNLSPDGSVSYGTDAKSRPILMRDHTIGRSEFDQAPFDLQGGFSWDEPVQRFNKMTTPANHFSKISRLNSLALNPLPQTNLNEPGKPEYFNNDDSRSRHGYIHGSTSENHRRWSGTRSYSNSKEFSSDYGFPHRRRHPSSSSGSSHKRHSSSENLPTKSYETEIFQSWSSGRKDEFESKNPELISSWGQYDHTAQGYSDSDVTYKRQNKMEGYNEDYRRKSISPTVHSSSHRNQTYSSSFYYNQRESSPPQDNQNSPYKSTPSRSHLSSKHRNGNYNVERRRSPPFEHEMPRSDPNNTYHPAVHSSKSHHSYASHSNKLEPIQYRSGSLEISPTKGNFDDVFEKKSVSTMRNHRAHRHVRQPQKKKVYTYDGNRYDYNQSSLSKPTRIKRDTSNQNEEASTKKDIKMIKRPGLNREHSITAQRLREAQQKKTSNYESSTRENHDSGHLTHARLDDNFSKNMFLPSADDAKELPFDQLELEDKFNNDLPIDDDIQNLSYATNEIDLGAKSPEKPPTLKKKDRLSTIEYIEKLIAEDNSQ